MCISIKAWCGVVYRAFLAMEVYSRTISIMGYWEHS